jgi:phosphoenolpyruvate carboxylase
MELPAAVILETVHGEGGLMKFLVTMEELSVHAYQAYLALVYETPGFEVFLGVGCHWRDHQPAHLAADRPARIHTGSKTCAIPRVFGWAARLRRLPGMASARP